MNIFKLLFFFLFIAVFLVDQSTQAGSGQNPNRRRCRDRLPNCRRFRPFCQHYKLVDALSRNCARTCGQCSRNPRQCRDLNPQCRNWNRNGFCRSRFYSRAIKKSRCAKTCRICKR
ncbi:hypothetical protein M3Y98_00052100 [Aphelenchoides besseyi]|nr:hypothetical protein M3Y98_00052100 [Aphelenchoides besseyi]KAI6198927.1 hypothetical protein M3Y96_00572500 [Aphelenchoides besseyi]